MALTIGSSSNRARNSEPRTALARPLSSLTHTRSGLPTTWFSTVRNRSIGSRACSISASERLSLGKKRCNSPPSISQRVACSTMDHKNFCPCNAALIASTCADANPPAASPAARATILGGDAGTGPADTEPVENGEIARVLEIFPAGDEGDPALSFSLAGEAPVAAVAGALALTGSRAGATAAVPDPAADCAADIARGGVPDGIAGVF